MAGQRLTDAQRAVLLRCPAERAFAAGEVGTAQHNVLAVFERRGWLTRQDAAEEMAPRRNGLRWQYRLTDAGRAAQAAERQG